MKASASSSRLIRVARSCTQALTGTLEAARPLIVELTELAKQKITALWRPNSPQPGFPVVDTPVTVSRFPDRQQAKQAPRGDALPPMYEGDVPPR